MSIQNLKMKNGSRDHEAVDYVGLVVLIVVLNSQSNWWDCITNSVLVGHLILVFSFLLLTNHLYSWHNHITMQRYASVLYAVIVSCVCHKSEPYKDG